MFKFLSIIIVLQTNIVLASSHKMHDHESHNHDASDMNMHKNANKEVDSDKYNNFIKGLSNVNIAIVDVNGMVCDFCARGIEKTFYNDELVKKVNVDLSTGKVLIAYLDTKNVNIEEIKNIFLINGQTATNVVIKEL